MKIWCILLLICHFLAGNTILTAQNQYEEFLLENQSDNETMTVKLEELEQLRANPIHINQASVKELLKIPFLNQQQAIAIITLRKYVGHIYNLNTLSQIDSFPLDLISAIQPYFTTEDRQIYPELTLYSRTRFKQKHPNAVGYSNHKYAGNPLKFYQRINGSIKNTWKAGIIVEKDAGEAKWNDHAAGFMEYSSVKNRLILGNFYIRTGQGLIFGGLNVSSLSSNPKSPLSRGTVRLRGYLSAVESNPCQGFAWQWTNATITNILFFSRAQYDASLNENQEIETQPNTGIHRTQTERNNQDQLTETRAGFSSQYSFGSTSLLNVNFLHTCRNRVFAPPDSIRNRFGFQDQTNQSASLFFQHHFSSLSISGEIAAQNNNSTAGSIQFSLSKPPFAFFTALWHYDPHFHNISGRAFGQFSSPPQNSRGFYAGLNYHLSTRFRVTGYWYFERPLWRTYFVPLPRYQQKSLLHLYHNSSPHVQWYAQWRINTTETKDYLLLNTPPDTVITGDIQKHNIRFQLSLGSRAHFMMRDRIEYTRISKRHDFSKSAPETGWLFFHDFHYHPVPEITIWARLCFFDTSGYDARIYTYENDVPGVLTNKILYGRGSHFFLLAKFRLFEQGNIAVKFASTYYDDRNSISSGNERIDANHLSEWTVFFGWKW